MEQIPIDTQLKMFDEHLSINERTILSAKFGDGKTFFLDKFKEEYKEKYYFITLYPVNYSVAENADVFEYIKRDILLQLANDGMLNPIDLNAAIDSIFNWNTLKEVISFLLTFIADGPILKMIMKKAETFKNEYDKRKKDIDKYNVFFENQKGGIYENDGYTQLIEKTLLHIKNQIQDSPPKKTVLIIEDLDRIDPAHLFRILNVFGSHFDCKFQKGTSCPSNKFGFDNIVTVFDYNVTEHIFHHFYGKDANYSGYINKFKKHNPFSYSISQIAKDYLYTFINKRCNIPYTKLNQQVGPKFPTVYSLIEKLSVRDICNISDNIEQQIKITQVESFNKIETFSSLSPLTLYMSVLVRMGISRNNIESYILATSMEVDLLNFIGTFLMLDRWFNHAPTVKYKNTNFEIIKYKEKNMITSVFFKQTETRYGESNGYNDITKAISQAINQALSYVYE